MKYHTIEKNNNIKYKNALIIPHVGIPATTTPTKVSISAPRPPYVSQN